MKIILASQSPRRRELMSLITDDFISLSSDVDEKQLLDGVICSSVERCRILAEAKARAVYAGSLDSLIIGCDTVVDVDGILLEKPENKEEAFEMIKLLSGKIHKVYTAVSIVSSFYSASFVCETAVEFFPVSDEEAAEYVSTDEPYDKAGGYAIQGLASRFIKRIDGDYFNVVGFPVSAVYRELKRAGVI